MPEPKIEPIRWILYPTDFSPASLEAMAHVERTAAATGAGVVVLHVFPMPDFWGSCGKPETVDEEIKTQLKEIRLRISGEVEHVAHGGAPGEVICWIAQDRECDLIVMGTHGRTGIRHAVLGSVAEYVVRRAPCPVLTVRQHAENERPIKEPEVYMPMPPIL